MHFKKFLTTFLVIILASASFSINNSRAGHGGYTVDYPDFSPQSPYYESITELSRLEIITGNADGTLRPTASLNRAELIALVMRATQKSPEPSDNNCFPDVREEWFAGLICKAFKEGYISGYPDGYFRPARAVTSGEASKILTNTIKNTSFQNLQEAQDFIHDQRFYRFKYSINDAIPRNETFERILRVLSHHVTDNSITYPSNGKPHYRNLLESDLVSIIDKKPVIMHFQSPWQVRSRDSEKKLLESFDQLTGNILWLRVDYEIDTELKNRYGMSTPDVFIVLNAAGHVVKTQFGYRTAQEGQAMINSALGSS